MKKKYLWFWPMNTFRRINGTMNVNDPKYNIEITRSPQFFNDSWQYGSFTYNIIIIQTLISSQEMPSVFNKLTAASHIIWYQSSPVKLLHIESNADVVPLKFTKLEFKIQRCYMISMKAAILWSPHCSTALFDYFTDDSLIIYGFSTSNITEEGNAH